MTNHQRHTLELLAGREQALRCAPSPGYFGRISYDRPHTVAPITRRVLVRRGLIQATRHPRGGWLITITEAGIQAIARLQEQP